jgi:hypothetical protein
MWVPGGTIGCHRFDAGDTYLTQGERAVILLDDARLQASIPGVVHAAQIWKIERNRVTTEFVADVPLNDVLEQIRDAPK